MQASVDAENLVKYSPLGIVLDHISRHRIDSCDRFGAGNIGRSLVGQLFSRAGYEVIFVDAISKVVDALNQRREYEVVIKDTLPPAVPDRIAVRNVRAISAGDTEAIAEAISHTDLIATAVGPAVLPKLAPNRSSAPSPRDCASRPSMSTGKCSPPTRNFTRRSGSADRSIFWNRSAV